MIKLINITKKYEVGNQSILALNDINLEFRENEFVCIYGPSGCGKTTMLNLIGGLDESTTGKILINNQDTSSFSSNDWDAYRNQMVGFVFQNYYLLPQLSVYENIEMALNLINTPKNVKREKVIKALEKVDLLKEANKMPNQLSGGQIQRVAIARAIVNDPAIVLADEPTGALDSKNAKIIMDILKEISKDRLVILVSHNLKLAHKYATRLVEMVDGTIIKDTNPHLASCDTKLYYKKKTSMSFYSSFVLGIKNLLRTKLRTPLTIFAGCIGMIGIGLVLSISKGVNIYIEDVQRSALANYPIRISSSVKVRNDDGSEVVPKEKYPKTEQVNILMGEIKRTHYNVIEDEFITHLEGLDPALYTIINYNKSISMNILSSNNYSEVYGGSFYELNDNQTFIESQYDVLRGKLPKEVGELALLIDEYNNLDVSTLSSLRIDYQGRESFTFDELLEVEYRLIDNNQLYYKSGEVYVKNYNRQELYNNSIQTLKITAILRAKPNADTTLYNTGILYTTKLTDLVLENALNSEIVKEQKAYGLSKNVFTNQPFEEYVSYSMTYSPEYQLEKSLIDLGAKVQTNQMYIYTSKFHDRLLIKDYVEKYSNKDANVNIRYNDYMNTITAEFSSLVKVFSTVLIIFSSVSLIVSSIMIGIITYVSVIQRTKEIGLLRSIGARKKDISRLFNVETMIIGFFSGLLGIIGVFILLNPVNRFVQNMVKEYTVSFVGVTEVIVARFEIKYMLFLLIGSMFLTLIAGYIPSKIASRQAPIDALRNER